MGTYNKSRAIEASLIDYIRDNLSGSWTGINIEKTYRRVYDAPLPSVCIRCGTTIHEKAEIGADSTTRNPQVLLDIFAENDGQRLDLKDFLIDILKNGVPYYNYTISGGSVQSKTQDGRIRILEISDEPVNFDANKNVLDVHDRYRHLLTFSVSLGRVEL